MGPDDKIYHGVPKVMQFKIPIPADYFGTLQLVLTNMGYASDYIVEFCGMAIVDVGENLPCLDPVDQVTLSMENPKTVDE